MTNNFSMKFKPSAQVEEDEQLTHKKRFKLCYSDHDTPLHAAAISLQETYLIVKHKASGREKEFKNITTFKGRGNKIGGWLGETNLEREEKGLSTFTIDDFEITEHVRIKPEFKNVEDALKYGLESIDFTVGAIKKHGDCEDYRLVVSGGNGNYREDYSRTEIYKGNRSDKPILYSDLKERFLEKYKNKIVLSNKNEAEDVLGIQAEEHRKEKGDCFDNWEICIQFIDKDVKNVYAPSFNIRKTEDGFRFPRQKDCTFELVSQVIAGDPTDNIRGIPNLTEEVTSKFGLRKANGCGKTTAENLIKDCETEKEMWERAVFAYQSYYGMEPVEFEAWDGEKLTWTWLDFMKETAILVKMQEYEGHLFDAEDVLKQHGINYHEKLFTEPEMVYVGDEANIKQLQNMLNDIINKDLVGLKSMRKADQKEVIDTIKNKLKSVSFASHYIVKTKT